VESGKVSTLALLVEGPPSGRIPMTHLSPEAPRAKQLVVCRLLVPMRFL
jgi:hypothetical protein